MTRSTPDAWKAMNRTIYALEGILRDIVPVPDARVHNVAMAVDELLREARAAYEEM